MNITSEQMVILKEFGLQDEYASTDDLFSALDDKITEIGFNPDYSLNTDGLKLQLLYDQLYGQNNKADIQ